MISSFFWLGPLVNNDNDDAEKETMIMIVMRVSIATLLEIFVMILVPFLLVGRRSH